jgi:hypothetical protein
MRYRHAQISDLEEILVLYYKYQIDSISEVDKPSGFVTTPFTYQQLQKLIEEENGLFIAIKDDQVVGYAMAASWRFWSAWPLFAYMVNELPSLTFKSSRLTTENTFQYGPICLDSSVRGQGVLEALFDFMKKHMSTRFPILVTFINKINGRSRSAHTRKLGLEVIHEFDFNGNRYIELACHTHHATRAGSVSAQFA